MDNSKNAQKEFLLSITEQHYKFKDDKGTPYVRFEKEGHLEIHELRSEEYENFLTTKLYEKYGSEIVSGTVNKILGIIKAETTSKDIVHKLHVRVAWHEGCLYYDLADKHWRAVKIDGTGWSIVKDPPILFKRLPHMLEQVEPQKGGKISKVFDYINVPSKFKTLFISTLAAMFIPGFDHPITIIYGKPGTGKTSSSRIIKSLVDPSLLDTVAFPATDNEMVQVIDKHHLIAFDNISKLSKSSSDILCRACTGGAYSKRQLYENDKEITYNLHQVILLNGLYQVGVENDLISRSFFFELEEIKKVMLKSEFDANFEKDKPVILGNIFTCISKAIVIKASANIPYSSRLGDFEQWAYSLMEGYNRSGNKFLKQFKKMSEIQNEEAILGHPLAEAVEIFVRKQKYWCGSPTELYNTLTDVAKKSSLDIKHKSWPKSASALSRVLNTISSNLDKAGISYTNERRESSGPKIELELKD